MTAMPLDAVVQPPPMTADRSRWLTDALSAQGETPIRASDCEALRLRLVEAIGEVARPVTVDGQLRARVRRVGAAVGGARWTARAGGRAVGLAAVGRCARGAARTPVEGVADSLDGLLGDATRGLAGPGSLGERLARLAPRALAALRAEAVNWATRLWLAVDWGAIGRGAVFDWRDQWWDCPGTPVALRGRAEVRMRSVGAHLTMRGGCPGPGAAVELGLSALVAALAASAPPCRVAGWWPDCGRLLVVTVSRPLLERASDSVATAVRAVEVSPSDGAQSGRR